jgi:hypothetical protein
MDGLFTFAQSPILLPSLVSSSITAWFLSFDFFDLDIVELLTVYSVSRPVLSSIPASIKVRCARNCSAFTTLLAPKFGILLAAISQLPVLLKNSTLFMSSALAS